MMSRTSNAGQDVPVKSDEANLDCQPPRMGSSVCSRMEPTRQLLSRGGCDVVCHADHRGLHTGNGDSVPPCLLCQQSHTVLDVEGASRVALMVTPELSDDVVDQVWEAISTTRAILKQQPYPMTVTLQTVFLRNADDAAICQKLFEAYYGDRMPPTNYVVQPPCGGQALAIEAWALGGDEAEIEFLNRNVVSVNYDGLRWIHVGGIVPPPSVKDAYTQAKVTFEEMAKCLDLAGSSFNDVVRTWLYQGGITVLEGEIERYRELNRARTDFFNEQEALGQMKIVRDGFAYYPASTGIGMNGLGLTVSCLGFQTERDDIRLLPLENPQQTSAFDYAKRFSVKSPKFSRAMALVIGDYATTWVSGTASIVNSETVFLDDAEKQTEQTIDNIEMLISPENCEKHGLQGAGAQLEDLAKVRVYVKRPEDYEICREVCQRRFGSLPTIYAQADVCRPDLLVEIEGVAFSRLS